MKKILIIEDDEKIALALSIRLKAHGYTTWTAGDGIVGMATARRCKPDLILLDIFLPAGNGFTLAEQFRQVWETRATPIILTTASQDHQLANKAKALGASGLLRKPYDAEVLASTIEAAFGRPQPTTRSISAGPQSGPGPVDGQARKRILIVEDDQKIAMGLVLRMKAAGFEPTVAADAISGVRSAVNQRPDLVLLDISLPAGNGFSVAEGIQRSIPTPVPIIFLTASKLPEFRLRAQELGGVGFFEKPYEAEALIAAVNHALTMTSTSGPFG
jgi:DNA-binding response OmpR family regulator